MSDENSKLVARGWFIGLGMIVPICFSIVVGNQVTSYIYRSTDDFGLSAITEDQSKNISIDEFKDVPSGNKVIILGVMSNKGDKPLSSITLEAEFFDDEGQFVREETEYVGGTLDPGERENFQIECGCKNKEFPKYKTVTVRATSASAY